MASLKLVADTPLRQSNPNHNTYQLYKLFTPYLDISSAQTMRRSLPETNDVSRLKSDFLCFDQRYRPIGYNHRD